MTFKGLVPKQTVIKKLKKANSLAKIADRSAKPTGFKITRKSQPDLKKLGLKSDEVPGAASRRSSCCEVIKTGGNMTQKLSMKQSPFLLGKEGKPKQVRAAMALNFNVLQQRPILTSRNHEIDHSDLEPALSYKMSNTYKRMLEDMKLDSGYKSVTAG